MPTAEEMNRGFDAVRFWADHKAHNAKPCANGLLIDTEYCTGCHGCEVACQMHLNLQPEQWGIKILEYGPIKNVKGDWEWTFNPMVTDLCDGCADRTKEGRLPMCVHNCWAGVMYYGPMDELAKKAAEKPKMILQPLNQD